MSEVAQHLIRMADAWEENSRRWYDDNRHDHPNGISWAGGFEAGWDYGATLLRDSAAAILRGEA